MGQLHTEVEDKFNTSVDIYARRRVELVHGPEGALSMKELGAQFSGYGKENMSELMP